MSDKKINKSSLKEAKANFDEIQKFAVEEATKNLQEDVNKKVIELMNNSLEEDTLKEEVTINADGTTITIDDNGNVEVDAEGESGGDEVGVEPAIEPIDMDSEIVISDEDDEIEIDKSEDMSLEEMSFEEQDAMAAPAPEAAPVEMPAEEMPVEMPAEEMPAEESAMVNPFEMMMDKMDQMMSMMGGSAGEEEIDIIDDTAAVAPEMAAPAPEAAPVAEEITFEVVNNEMQVPEMEAQDDVLEIVGEMEEEEYEENAMEEMHGVGHNLRHSNTNAKTPRQGVNHRKDIKENKAQYEVKLTELIKENDSLKKEKEELDQELIKFENGFIKLQENFSEMQDYNAKLVMAYKVAMSGGLTTDEKVQISEQFDKCDTVEDAEKLYKSIVSEHQIKVNKNPEKSIKSNSIKTVQAKSVSQPLYESKEILRMKKLAGIKRNEI